MMVPVMNSSDIAWFVVIVILGLNASGATSTVFQSILPGDRLFASNSDVLVSPNGAFAFGFFSGNLSSQVYLGIWFAGIIIRSDPKKKPVAIHASFFFFFFFMICINEILTV